jgi:cellulose biosynthesis protein BcsQ
MKILALFNHKGGVGKTTLAVNVGEALVDLGFRVLLVDADHSAISRRFT